MEKIDYLYPTALEQIKAAVNGSEIPSNDENRDGRVKDVRYLSSVAIEQIKSACGGGSGKVAKYLYHGDSEPYEKVEPIYAEEYGAYMFRATAGYTIFGSIVDEPKIGEEFILSPDCAFAVALGPGTTFFENYDGSNGVAKLIIACS